MQSKVTIGGYPIHPMLVAFPIASYVGTLLCFIAYSARLDLFWYRAGIVANAAGVVMAVVAAIPGVVDWATAVPKRTAAKRDGAIHAALNVAALVLFAICLGVASGRWNDAVANAVLPDAGGPIVLSALGVLSTLGAGWFGWRMVQTHHVGVEDRIGERIADPMSRLDTQDYPLRRTGTDNR